MSLLLLAAAGAAAEAPICPDRPGKANAVCTVPAGKIQVEFGALDWTRMDEGGQRTDVLYVGSTLLKYGLSDRTDIELNVSPYVWVRSEGQSISGAGDVVVRVKQRLTGDDAPVQVALIPFIKLPTAKHGIGNRKWEGGLAATASFDIGGGVSATLGPEVDVLADGDGRGSHAAIVNVLSLSGAIAPRLSLSGELWSNFELDPAGTVRQASADAALAYAVNDRLQLDGGVNVGLTNETPDLELYTGVSLRF
ncbi:transporter [Sphingomonas sp.]|uniref:transporter n=1 Tax=Sphingomonas sp. TaxID=28214 RepID=UPI002600EC88|nr:transporter [Sphingomonas sp.]